jgi:hypothetical protein
VEKEVAGPLLVALVDAHSVAGGKQSDWLKTARMDAFCAFGKLPGLWTRDVFIG